MPNRKQAIVMEGPQGLYETRSGIILVPESGRIIVWDDVKVADMKDHGFTFVTDTPAPVTNTRTRIHRLGEKPLADESATRDIEPPTPFEPPTDREVWEAAQANLDAKRATARPRRPKNAPKPFAIMDDDDSDVAAHRS